MSPQTKLIANGCGWDGHPHNSNYSAAVQSQKCRCKLHSRKLHVNYILDIGPSTLGAISKACGCQVCNPHANGFMTKLTKLPFTYKWGLCCMLCSPHKGTKHVTKPAFACQWRLCCLCSHGRPSANYMRVTHLVSTCLALCPQCQSQCKEW
jgi:hypothetical protein